MLGSTILAVFINHFPMNYPFGLVGRKSISEISAFWGILIVSSTASATSCADNAFFDFIAEILESVVKKSVSTLPGQIVTHRILSVLTSRNRHCINPLTANFEAQYAVAPAKPFLPASELIVMIVPLFFNRIFGRTARERRKTPRRFAPSTDSKSCLVVSRTGLKIPNPALLTRTSMAPNFSSNFSTNEVTSSSIETSHYITRNSCSGVMLRSSKSAF